MDNNNPQDQQDQSIIGRDADEAPQESGQQDFQPEAEVGESPEASNEEDLDVEFESEIPSEGGEA
jgi:hypothetical protein